MRLLFGLAAEGHFALGTRMPWSAAQGRPEGNVLIADSPF
jgi:hypothetical protein